MTSSNRGDRIQLLHKVLKKYYKTIEPPEGRPLLEQLIYACCLEDARYECADEAFHRLQEAYFDWNEIRVTTVTELGEVLHNLPDPLTAGLRVKRNLQSIFETRYSFDIEDMRKMNQGKAIQELEKLGGMTKFVLGYLLQNAFGGHTIPVSSSIMQVLVATGILTQAEADKNSTPGLDRAIAKTKGIEFASCVHQLAADIRAQPHNKNLRLILKEAGAVDPPKRPAVIEKKAEAVKPPPAKEKTASKENVAQTTTTKGHEKTSSEKVAAKPADKKLAEPKKTPNKPTPSKAAVPKPPAAAKSSDTKSPKAATGKKDPAKKGPAAGKKTPPQKITKRKPK